ncbi:hypothetical protein [Paraglaciecola chathamensis]|uniref:hypothetical protein n=1 Tax=Paraglaciecola chathamensis TaxID=368405 RepID=UPI00270D144A|nr:hypothetical protein [Paraglaciecola chathamensis]MDO6559910.1 hypothetical protein [Paraglaciecola chathamensis]
MPVTFIKNPILQNLANIGFKRMDEDFQPHVRDTLKETLISGDGIDVTFFSSREFELKVSENLYSRIISTDFYFSYQKVQEHTNCFIGPSVKHLPVTWLIVGAYYSAFYSAIELGRLFGIYNIYLNKVHCDSIASHTEGNKSIDRGNYIGIVKRDIDKYVTIRFSSREKSPPHDLAWKNILEILNGNNANDVRPAKVEILKLCKSILNSSNQLINTPNNVRNDWNYSFPNAYSSEFCSELDELKSYLTPTSRKSITHWPKSYKKQSAKQKNVYSVIYIESILRQVMKDINDKLYINQ